MCGGVGGNYHDCLSISPIHRPMRQYNSRTPVCNNKEYASPSSMGILLPTHHANLTASPLKSNLASCSSTSLSLIRVESHATVRKLCTKHLVRKINSFVPKFSAAVFVNTLVVNCTSGAGGR